MHDEEKLASFKQASSGWQGTVAPQGMVAAQSLVAMQGRNTMRHGSTANHGANARHSDTAGHMGWEAWWHSEARCHHKAWGPILQSHHSENEVGGSHELGRRRSVQERLQNSASKTEQKSAKKKHYKHTHPFPALIAISLRLVIIICGTQSQIPIKSFPFISLLHKLQKMFLP